MCGSFLFEIEWTWLLLCCEQLRPDRGPGKASEVAKTTVFVSKLPQEVDEDSLSSMFADVGLVMLAKVERNPDGSSKGWG